MHFPPTATLELAAADGGHNCTIYKGRIQGQVQGFLHLRVPNNIIDADYPKNFAPFKLSIHFSFGTWTSEKEKVLK